MNKGIDVWDVVVVGGGPAALTAAIYAARYNLKVLVLAGVFGGLMAEAHKICNFPSEKSILGSELMTRMKEHAEESGASLRLAMVNRVIKEKGSFRVVTNSEEVLGKTVILALGTSHRKLSLPSEKKYLGKGVSYCFTCDGRFYKGKRVGIIGGSDAAITAAIYFSDICPKVYLIYRGDKLRAEHAWLENLAKKSNVEVLYQTNVVDLLGEKKLEAVMIDKPHQESNKILLDGLFVQIGEVPDRAITEKLGLSLTKEGFVKIDISGRTNIEGVWAAGDITTGSSGFRQVITACAEGAIASQDIFKYLKEKK